ncbi:MAG: hypothetical protein KC502_12220 [Myxococcales bacterium]|nr:hypothetical protein [Myxococcales bacterium]
MTPTPTSSLQPAKLLAAVALALAAWIIGDVAAIEPPPPIETIGAQRYGLTKTVRRGLATELAKNEPRWRGFGKRKFSTKPWSAEDDYHWHVQAHIERKLAKRLKQPPSHIWALYDEIVAERWSATGLPNSVTHAAFSATVVPLRPRQR